MKNNTSIKNLEDAIQFFNDNDCVLLSSTYKDNNTKMSIECKCGETFVKSIRGFKQLKYKCCIKCSRKIVASKRSYTHDYVSNFIKNEGCELLSIYIKSSQSLDIKCKCGEVFTTRFNEFNSGNKRQCNRCSGKSRDTLNESIECFERHNKDSFKITEYPRVWKDQVTLECLKCNNKSSVSGEVLLRNNPSKIRKCKNCEPRYTFKKVKDIFEKEGYILLESGYINASTKMKVWCPYCDSIHYKTLSALNQGKQCSSCWDLRKMDAKIRRFFINNIKHLILKDISYKLNENACKVPQLTLQCLKGHVFEVNWSQIRNNETYECKVCRGLPSNVGIHRRIDDSIIIKSCKDKLIELGYADVAVTGKVDRNKVGINKSTIIRIELECKTHGLFWINKSDLFRKKGKKLHICSLCSDKTSKGELEISKFLNKHNLEFDFQRYFNGCIYKKEMPFDFYIESLNIVIEYNGRQHYEPVEYFGGKTAFKARVEKDNIKREYCLKNKITLLEIPYWEFDDIEKILTKELNI